MRYRPGRCRRGKPGTAAVGFAGLALPLATMAVLAVVAVLSTADPGAPAALGAGLLCLTVLVLAHNIGNRYPRPSARLREHARMLAPVGLASLVALAAALVPPPPPGTQPWLGALVPVAAAALLALAAGTYLRAGQGRGTRPRIPAERDRGSTSRRSRPGSPPAG